MRGGGRHRLKRKKIKNEKNKNLEYINMITSILAWLLNTLHLVLLFIPFILLAIPNTYLRKQALLVKIIALIVFLTPLHWRFLDNQCLLSVISIKMGNKKYNTSTNAPFTRENLGPLYKPIMWLFGLKWESDEELDLVTSSHWVINFIVTWYVLAFKLCKN